MKKFLVITLLLAAPAFAQPSVQSLNGTLTAGNTVTIQGVGFGYKGSPAPLLFDDFSSGTPGELICTGSGGSGLCPGTLYDGWYGFSGGRNPNVMAWYTDSLSVDGRPDCLRVWHPTAGNSFYLIKNFTATGRPQRLLWDADMKMQFYGPNNRAHNIKPIRWRTGSNPVNSIYTSFGCTQTNAGVDWNQDPEQPPITYPSGECAAYQSQPSDQYNFPQINLTNWINEQWVVQENSDPDVQDGWQQIEWGNVIRYDSALDGGTGCYLSTVGSYTQLIFGGQCSTLPDGSTCNTTESPGADTWWDHVYADTTWARIELGNAPTYYACTERTIQVPSAWSATSASFTVRTNQFSTGQSVYVFLVDQYNNPSNGFGPIGVGGSSSATPVVGNVTGRIAPGERITVTGSNFGYKGNGPPVNYEDFESNAAVVVDSVLPRSGLGITMLQGYTPGGAEEFDYNNRRWPWASDSMPRFTGDVSYYGNMGGPVILGDPLSSVPGERQTRAPNKGWGIPSNSIGYFNSFYISYWQYRKDYLHSAYDSCDNSKNFLQVAGPWEGADGLNGQPEMRIDANLEIDSGAGWLAQRYFDCGEYQVEGSDILWADDGVTRFYTAYGMNNPGYGSANLDPEVGYTHPDANFMNYGRHFRFEAGGHIGYGTVADNDTSFYFMNVGTHRPYAYVRGWIGPNNHTCVSRGYGPLQFYRTSVNVYLASQFNEDGSRCLYCDETWNGMFMSEAYFDTTVARIEIGEAPTWADSYHREIMIPVTWSDNTITFDVPNGLYGLTWAGEQFQPGDTRYLYVIDRKNFVNANGYPVILGTEQAEPPPGPPGRPIRVNAEEN